MKFNELEGKDVEALEGMLQDRKKEAQNLRFQIAMKQAANPVSIRYLKKEIARIETKISQLKARAGEAA